MRTPLFARSMVLAGLLVQPVAAAQGPPAGLRPELTDTEREQLIRDLSVLAHDSMEGRRAGTPGGERARRFLVEQLGQRGLEPVASSVRPDEWLQPFPLGGAAQGANVLGMVRGTQRPGLYFVVTAHYDHLGVQNGQVFNGADDNASGTAALLALAEHFAREPPRHSLVFLATDAEEGGLVGARAFVQDPPIPLDSIVMNVNLDMVSRSDAGELYAAGTYHYPWLAELLNPVAARSPIAVIMGHDRPGLPPGDDWTGASDHAAFHQAGIPFLYFGVEDHPGYHQPTDDVEAITPDFYVDAVETVIDFIRTADARGDELMDLRRNAG